MNKQQLVIITDGKGGNDVKKMLKLVPYLPLGTHVEATHEPGCGNFSGQPCNCDPNLRVVGRYAVGADS